MCNYGVRELEVMESSCDAAVKFASEVLRKPTSTKELVKRIESLRAQIERLDELGFELQALRQEVRNAYDKARMDLYEVTTSPWGAAETLRRIEEREQKQKENGNG